MGDVLCSLKSLRSLLHYDKQFYEQCIMIGNYCVTAIYLLVPGGFYVVASGLYVAAVLPASMCAALDGRHPRWCGICTVIWKPPGGSCL